MLSFPHVLKASPTCLRLSSQFLALARRCWRTAAGRRIQAIAATVTTISRSSMRVKAPHGDLEAGAFISYLSVGDATGSSSNQRRNEDPGANRRNAAEHCRSPRRFARFVAVKAQACQKGSSWNHGGQNDL